MTILQDSREQIALEFNNPYITGIEVIKLDVGDYGCRFKDGYSPSLYFERKSIGDLFQTLGVGYKRFKRELIRAQENKVSLIIIVEGSLTKVLRGSRFSTLEGVTVAYKLFTLRCRYGIETVFCRDREDMSEYITHRFIGEGKDYMRRLKNGKSKRDKNTG